jgi:HKD family nuclease
MFWDKQRLTNIFNEVEELTGLLIATAYLSKFGVDLLKKCIIRNSLKREQVQIYISKEFDSNNPALLLQELQNIAQVFIVDNEKLHAKVYFFQKKNQNQIVYGSANLTKGGCQENLEFINVETNIDQNRIGLFFEHCYNCSIEVTPEIIECYREIYDDIKKVFGAQKKLSNRISSIFGEQDPYTEADYDLDNQYFSFEDYETLFPKFQHSGTTEVMNRRKTIQYKMLKVHNILEPKLKQLNLNRHWSKKHITSLLNPSWYNHGRVSWIGIRYGKQRKEVQFLNTVYNYRDKQLMGDDDGYGNFQKHACMQFSFLQEGVSVGLFHAVANGAIDRYHLEENIDKLDKVIVKHIEILKGEGFTWSIYDGKNDKVIKDFQIDKEDAAKFIDFYKKHDSEGLESFCTYHVLPDDPRLRDEHTIADLIFEKILVLKPIYDTIVFRPPILK